MQIYYACLRQYNEISQGGWPVFFRKANRAFQSYFLWLPGIPLAVIFFFIIRLSRPWLLIRINPLISCRIGHFAANTELYLCERDAGINVPRRLHIDLCYNAYAPLANKQLATMWKRYLRIWPAWILGPTFELNRILPGGSIHEVGSNSDRDIHNLLGRTPPHLNFTPDEEIRGKAGLRAMNIPAGAEFICLIARDSAYLNKIFPHGNFNQHSHRDCDIQNYVLAAESLADRGYYVIRMGEIVKEPINSSHPKIIDYATNGMRSDFMDIYLGANCLFCISCATGFDAIPLIFRRPIAYVNMLPIGYFFSFLKDTVGLCKKYWLVSEQRWLSLKEIFNYGIGYYLSSYEYDAKGVKVVENSPDEIRSLVIEMLERLKGEWQPKPDDAALQHQFWEIYPINAQIKNKPLHGKVRALYGAQFLRDNRWWLEY